MKLPALLAVGFVIVFGLGVYFLKRPEMSPAFLLYPAAWAVIGVLFFGLNTMLGTSSQPASDTPSASSETP
ncbi:MAG: hypothetical protein IID44_26815 [Planctomycetes bacterium]|nr:hypothetical protein [Planctomycetota bacterium]